MKIMQIPHEKFGSATDPETKMLEIREWCKEQGLIERKEFDCFYISSDKTYHIRFYGDGESIGGLFTKKFL